jgi:hypothetical protein
MPAEGWRNVSIRKEYYEILEARAKMNRRSISGELEKILIDAGIIKPIEEVPAKRA